MSDDAGPTQPVALRDGASGDVASFGHRPALDGVRGFAVVMVVLFHGGFTLTKGGYLGVSVFFTLSGFLITSLALIEFARTDRLAIGAFWLRRVKRLMPALLVALSLAVLAVALAGHDSTRRQLLGDVLGGATYLQNWRWVFTHRSYADLFASPSPLLHLWSLSVEEQFYVVFPLLAAVVLRWGRWALAGVAAVVAFVGVLLPIVFGWSVDRVYYGTDVRAGEIAVGVLAAVILFGRATVATRWVRRTLATVSSIAVLAILAACVLLAQTWNGWRNGGFLVFSFVSVAVVVAAALDVGPVAVVGRTRVLRRLGRVSYGLYLYHWIVLWFLGAATSLDSTWRFVIGIALSYALAELSLYALEDPVRTGEWPWKWPWTERTTDAIGPRPSTDTSRLRRVHRGALTAFGVVLVIVVLASGATRVASTASPNIDFAAMNRKLSAALSHGSGADGALTMAFFGDSTATMTAIGVAAATDEPQWRGRFAVVPGDTRLGCGVLVPQLLRGADGREYILREECFGLLSGWQAAIDANRPDLAVLETGRWETWDMRLPDIAGWRQLGDPVFDDWATTSLRDAVEVLGSRGAVVVLLTPPSQSRGETVGPDASDERLARWTQILRTVAAESPDRVVVVDLAAWHAAQGARDVELRRDGVHVDQTTGVVVADEYLLPAFAGFTDGRLSS